jgi:ATP-dependent Lhr-like helicase
LPPRSSSATSPPISTTATPLAERRAQALAIDHAQLRELVGETELRDLLDADVLEEVERQLQHLDPDFHVRSADGLHDLLLRIDDLTIEAAAARSAGHARAWIAALLETRRAIELRIAGESRLVAVEDAARCRDGLGTPLPQGIPGSLLAPVADPLGDLVLRHARTHAPFTAGEVAARYGLGRPVVEGVLRRLTAAGRLLEGAFRPGGREREWCAPDVLAALRRRARARLRHEIEPVEPPCSRASSSPGRGRQGRGPGWTRCSTRSSACRGRPWSPPRWRPRSFRRASPTTTPRTSTRCFAAGEVVWAGLEPLGERDGRLALFLADQFPRLCRPRPPAAPLAPREQACADALRRAGASFFAPLHEAAGGGYPGETLDALWSLVWKGIVTNDTLHALRVYVRPPARDRRAAARSGGRAFRSRRTVSPSAEGRWSLVESRLGARPSDTAWSATVAEQLLARYGVVSREVAAAEGIEGGFPGVYEVLRALEERGRIRRGCFVSGVGALQFALPAALDLLRSMRVDPEEPEVVWLSATDPANPYGVILRWPAPDGMDPAAGRGPARSAGASVVLVNGRLGVWVSRSRQVLTFLPESEPERTIVARGVAAALADLARTGEGRHGGLLVAEINGVPAGTHPLGPFLEEAGFVASALGFQVRREIRPRPSGATRRLTAPSVRRGARNSRGREQRRAFARAQVQSRTHYLVLPAGQTAAASVRPCPRASLAVGAARGRQDPAEGARRAGQTRRGRSLGRPSASELAGRKRDDGHRVLGPWPAARPRRPQGTDRAPGGRTGPRPGSVAIRRGVAPIIGSTRTLASRARPRHERRRAACSRAPRRLPMRRRP